MSIARRLIGITFLFATLYLFNVSEPIPVVSVMFSFIFSFLYQTWMWLAYSFNITLTLTFGLSTIVWMFLISIFSIFIFVRYYLQTRYSKLKNESNDSYGLKIEDIPTPRDEKLAYSDSREFLSAFLSSVKVFGYLEANAFQELVKHLTEVKLKTGDFLFKSDDMSRSYYVVVEGSIQVFIQNYDKNLGEDAPLILNEVKSGGSVSSLFNILSVFSENHCYSAEERKNENSQRIFLNFGSELADVDGSKGTPKVSKQNKSIMVNARATSPSSIVVLPEEAFASLSTKFPKSAAQIIQIILTRFQRVTSHSLRNYLGLHNEILKLEKDLKDASIAQVPLGLLQAILKEFEKPSIQRKEKSTIFQMHCKDLTREVELKNDLFEYVSASLGICNQQSDPNRLHAELTTVSNLSRSNSNLSLDNVNILYCYTGAIILDIGQKDCELYLVIHGNLEARVDNSKSSYTIQAGGLVGYLSSISGHPSLVRVTAKTDCCLMSLDRSFVESYVEIHHEAVFKLGMRLFNNLSTLVRRIDFALEWLTLNAEEILFHENEESDGIYLILHGRLRGIRKKKDDKGYEYIREYGQKESIGEAEVLLNQKRSLTVHAIRDTELIRLPKMLFNSLSLQYPEITLQISKIIAMKSQETKKDAIGETSKIKTLCLLPFGNEVPLSSFSDQLYKSLSTICVCKLLDQSTLLEGLGKNAFRSLAKLRLTNWLAEQEEKYDIILYIADSHKSFWTQLCIRQADCIFLVCMAELQDPNETSDYERLLYSLKTTARKELVLLHNEESCRGGLTNKWLKKRPYISGHYHVSFPFLNNSRSIARRRSNQLSLMEKSGKDFLRLARILTGKAVGVVLGGGGVKGAAQIGVLKALEEAGIPVDIIGGTSMGAFIGGLYAKDTDTVYGRAKNFSAQVASYWRSLMDLTYPVTSWFTGHSFNRAIWKIFLDTQIEDLWLNYFVITTNITDSKMEVHRQGYAWRYIRASMSLSGFLPPLCDQGRMLVDGGYVNNLPVDVMKQQGAHFIIAVDVAREDDGLPVDYPDAVSGWYILFQHLFSQKVQVPTIAEIQSRLAYVSNVKRVEEVKTTVPNCVYLKPPVIHFGVMDFAQFKPIVQIGYDYGKQKIDEWEKSGFLSVLRQENSPNLSVNRSRRNSI